MFDSEKRFPIAVRTIKIARAVFVFKLILQSSYLIFSLPDNKLLFITQPYGALFAAFEFDLDVRRMRLLFGWLAGPDVP